MNDRIYFFRKVTIWRTASDEISNDIFLQFEQCRSGRSRNRPREKSHQVVRRQLDKFKKRRRST